MNITVRNVLLRVIHVPIVIHVRVAIRVFLDHNASTTADYVMVKFVILQQVIVRIYVLPTSISRWIEQTRAVSNVQMVVPVVLPLHNAPLV